MERVFIAGCGYIGGRLARIWQQRGAAVSCTVRSPEKGEALAVEKIQVLAEAFDDPSGITLPDLSGVMLYYLVPPPGGGTTDTRARNFVSRLQQNGRPAKIVYMSATSVYSETRGGVVTEDSPAEPVSAMGKRRRDAERAFLDYGAANDVPVVVLRVSGIYGPGRLPLMQISQGQPLLREEESGPSNRIHADDLAEICVAAAERGAAGEVYNVSDGHPTSMTSYFNACADLLGFPRQPQVTLDEARRTMSPLMLSYVTEARIVDNSRMLARLAVTLRYPCMGEGLQACR